MHKLASAFQSFEQAPDISQYKFNNLFFVIKKLYPYDIHLTIHNA